jgi:DNA polymerase-3 subunit epsilon
MNLLGIDLETTGLDVDGCYIIEVGAVLWDHGRGVPVDVLSKLVYEESTNVSAEITELTGITQADLARYGHAPEVVLAPLAEMAKKSRAIVCHHGTKFDRPILGRYFGQLADAGKLTLDKERRLWIDTKTDIPFPDSLKARRLKYMAADHGFINPFEHRAVFDVLTMLRVLQHYDIDVVMERARSAYLEVQAHVDYDTNQLAKDRRFKWNGEQKIWWKELKEIDLAAAQEEAPFEITILRTVTAAQEPEQEPAQIDGAG